MPEPIEPSPQQWDSFIKEQPRAHILQRAGWGDLKAAFGWQVKRIALEEDGHLIAGAQVLLRPLPLKLGTMAYLPMGPYANSDESLADLWKAIDRAARDEGAAFLKWEPGIFEGGMPDIHRWGFRESPQTVQPPNTILIDLIYGEDDLLSRMSQTTRRKVRLGERKGVTYRVGTPDDIPAFAALMETTGERNEFGVHEPDYYRMAYDLFAPDNTAALILAENEGDLLAAEMVFKQGQTAWYLYGASANVKRNLMASYGVQWESILWAKRHGATSYDMWGIPDETEDELEAGFEKRTDGLWGVYGFKRGWGGHVARSVGAWDKVYNPLVYAAYWAATQLREG
ncbi:MAG: lipid II:glycine glycyltransferase FemX [Phototrophicaceae bacterium]